MGKRSRDRRRSSPVSSASCRRTGNSVLTRRNLTNAAEIYLLFPHEEVSDYERGLLLNTATAYCRYTCDGVRHTREYFASYPDGVLVIRLSADHGGGLSFTLAPEVPFQHPFGDEASDCAMGRTATVTAATVCELLELNRPTLDGITAKHPRVRVVLNAFYHQRAGKGAS